MNDSDCTNNYNRLFRREEKGELEEKRKKKQEEILTSKEIFFFQSLNFISAVSAYSHESIAQRKP